MSFIDIIPPTGYTIGFQNTIDFTTVKYCFKYEYADQGKRCCLVGNDRSVFLKWMSQLPKSQKKFYELIREDDPVAEFYDIDLAISNLPESHVTDMSHEIINALLDARNEVSDQTISRKDLVVLSAHTPTKLSLHVISKRTYFTNNQLHGLFAKTVYEEIVQQRTLGVHHVNFNIDTSVYSRNRCFRMYQNHKHGKDNALIVFEPIVYNFASMEDTLVVLDKDLDLSSRELIRKYNVEDVVIQQHHDYGEVLCKTFEGMLDTFLNNHPYLQLSHNNRLNRVDHVTRPCLTDPTDSHSTENMFWFVNHNALYVHCFCRKGTPLCLGQRSGTHKVQLAPESFAYGTHCSDDFRSYADLGEFTTLMDKRRTGRGKTTCAMEYASQFERVLLVHHRLTLDDDYITKYPSFVSYQTNTTAKRQTVCYNSLHKIDVSKYDLIIIDEIRSILKQSEMKNMLYATHTLFSIMENRSIPLVMLDANMTNSDVEFIMSFRKDPHPVVIHDPHVETDKKVFMYISKQRSEYESMVCMIQRRIDRGDKIILIYNRAIESMNAFLSLYTKTRRILHINRLTRSNISMDSSTWYDDYDIIAYSPTISEGVSITDPRFATVHAYGLFVSTSCPAESVSQMIARFRAVNTFHVHVDASMKKSSVPVVFCEDDVHRYLMSNLHTLACNVERSQGTLHVIKDDFYRLYCKNMIETSYDYHNYAQTIVQKLINNGYQLFYSTIDGPTDKEALRKEVDFSQHLRDARESENTRVNQGIVDAPVISYMEVNTLKDNVQSEEDQFKVDKFMLASMLSLKPEYLTVDIVDKFRKDQASRTIIRNLKQCFCFVRDMDDNVHRVPVEQLLKENTEVTMDTFTKMNTFGTQKKCATSFTLSRFWWLNQTVRELGFSAILTSETIPREDYEANMSALIDKYNKSVSKVQSMKLLFGRKGKWLDVNKKRLTELFAETLGIRFVAHNGQVRQQVYLPILFHDASREYPSLMGSFALPDSVIEEYSPMFGAKCPICNQVVVNVQTHMKEVVHDMTPNTKQPALQYKEEGVLMITDGKNREEREGREEEEQQQQVDKEEEDDIYNEDEEPIKNIITTNEEKDDIYNENETKNETKTTRTREIRMMDEEEEEDDIYQEDELLLEGMSYDQEGIDAYDYMD